MPDRPRSSGHQSALPGIKVHRIRRQSPRPAPAADPPRSAPSSPSPAAPTPEAQSPASAAFATARAPAAAPDAQDQLRDHMRRIRQMLADWRADLHSLEQTLGLIELLVDPAAATHAPGTTDTSEPTDTTDAAALLPLLQTLLTRRAGGGGDLTALLAHPALAGLLGRQS